MSRNIPNVLKNSKREFNFSKVMNFGEGVAILFLPSSFTLSSKSSVKLHSETGTMFGTLPLRQSNASPDMERLGTPLYIAANFRFAFKDGNSNPDQQISIPYQQNLEFIILGGRKSFEEMDSDIIWNMSFISESRNGAMGSRGFKRRSSDDLKGSSDIAKGSSDGERGSSYSAKKISYSERESRAGERESSEGENESSESERESSEDERGILLDFFGIKTGYILYEIN